jgi:hypothetical protein
MTRPRGEGDRIASIIAKSRKVSAEARRRQDAQRVRDLEQRLAQLGGARRPLGGNPARHRSATAGPAT